jgi:CubicO group peptidase (beta-lactamase class C family)
MVANVHATRAWTRPEPGRQDCTSMSISLESVAAACDTVLDEIRRPPYRHTSHLYVAVAREVVVDEHLRGPLVNDVFSITKSVLASVLGVVAASGGLPDLDQPLVRVLPDIRGTPAEAHTWRHLLTMTRGAETGGAWDVDEITALARGQVPHVAAAPQRTAPGVAFAYDNGGAHLLSAATTRLLGEPVSDFAQRELFGPLGIEDAYWRADPDGIPFGYAHLHVKARDLARLGHLWLDGGRCAGRQVIDASYLHQMTQPHEPGGPPENLPYGFLTWLPPDAVMAGGWAGQHLLVIPAATAVVVVTGDPRFQVGPPPSDELPADWRPALDLVRRHVLPTLLDRRATDPSPGRWPWA